MEGDIVDLSQLTCSRITLATGHLYIPNEVTLQGPGADRLTISAYNLSQVIVSASPGRLVVTDLTIADGRYADDAFPEGGCISATGSVQLDDVVVTRCSIANATSAATRAAKGGAVYARQDVILHGSTVTNGLVTSNSASASAVGGGIYAGRTLAASFSTITSNSATLTQYSSSAVAVGGGALVYGSLYLYSSLVANNRADETAGLLISACNYLPAIINSTISDNTSTNTRFGSGVFSGCDIEITNSTITGNTESHAANMKYGAGVRVGNGSSADIESSIVANNEFVGSSGSQSDDIMGGDGAGITGSHDIIQLSGLTVPADTINDDPMLGPLADNGGLTMTHAVLAGSPAIDSGDNLFELATDQRGPGFSRSVGTATDIGAFEYSAVVDTIFMDGFERATAQGERSN